MGRGSGAHSESASQKTYKKEDVCAYPRRGAARTGKRLWEMTIAHSFSYAEFRMERAGGAEQGGMVRQNMEHKRLTAEELQRRRRLLARLAEEAERTGDQNLRPAANMGRMFELSTPEGRQVYESFPDAALLELLRAAAQKLGHSPAQKEIFWVYRGYLHARFEKWPYALRMAGLGKSAGRCGQSPEESAAREKQMEALLRQVREKTLEIGRTPHPGDLPQVCERLKKRYHTWGEVLQAAGVERVRDKTVRLIEDLEPPYRALLEEIRQQAEALGRAPLRHEVEDAARTSLVERCGSWRNALYQIGLEPVVHISPFSTAYLAQQDGARRKRHRGTLYDCYYRVLNLDDEARAMLAQLQETAARLGRPPEKHDVPPELRRGLQAACGSWSNALFQLGLHEKSNTVEE